MSFCGILLLFWIVGKLTEKIGLPSVRPPPLSIPRDRRRRGLTTASPPSRPSVSSPPLQLIGEILAGIAVGPHGLQIAPKPDALIMLGEFGLVLMVLEAGVEVDLQQLALVGQRGVAVAFAGSLFPLAIGATLGRLVFGMNAMSSLAVGASLAPTSMGISLKVLQDGGVLGTPTGQLIIAAAVMDDVIALVLLSELEAMKHPSAVDFIVPIVSSACFIVVVGYCAVRVVPDVLVRRVVPRVAKENVEGLLLGLVFVVAYALMVVLHYGRSSHLLGAFLGGLCFCSLSSMQHTWHFQVEKILSWLVRVFFACTIGFEVPIRDLWTGPVLARAGVFLIAALGKIATGLFAKPLTRVEAMKIGFAMSAWGEFAFIVATASREAGTMSSEDYSAVILAVLLSAIYSPYAVKYAVDLDKANIVKREDRASVVRLDDVEEGLPSALAAGPGGETVVMHRVYYVCVVEVPSRWGLYDAVFKAMRDASVDMDVLDVSIKPRAGWGVCELFLRDPNLRAPLDASLSCAENREVEKRIGAVQVALELLLLRPEGSVKGAELEGEVLLARWVPDLEPEDAEDAADDKAMRQADDLLRGSGGTGSVARSSFDGDPGARELPPGTPQSLLRRRSANVCLLRSETHKPVFRTRSLVDLLNNFPDYRNPQDEELHGAFVDGAMHRPHRSRARMGMGAMRQYREAAEGMHAALATSDVAVRVGGLGLIDERGDGVGEPSSPTARRSFERQLHARDTMTLSGASGAQLATELRAHLKGVSTAGLTEPGRLSRRISWNAEGASSPDQLSASDFGSSPGSPVTSLTGASARELAAALREQLRRDEEALKREEGAKSPR